MRDDPCPQSEPAAHDLPQIAVWRDVTSPVAERFREACEQILAATPSRAEVVLWHADLNRLTRRTQPGTRDLVVRPDEVRQAARFRSAVHAERFLARRWLRRVILAAHCQCPVKDIEISTACLVCGHPSHGKPRLVRPGSQVEFSTASLPETAVIAVSTTPVGVDIESERRMKLLALDGVDRATGGGWSAVSAAVGGQVPEIRVWTALEALTKGLGLGLAASAADVERSLAAWTWQWCSPVGDTLVCMSSQGETLPRMAVQMVPDVR